MQFIVDGGAPATLAEFLSANADSPEVCAWALSAQPGDVFADISRCECIGDDAVAAAA